MSTLDALSRNSTIAIDSATFLDYAAFPARDATSNPSILLSAVKDSAYDPLVKKARSYTHLAALFTQEMLKKTTGTISVELDPRLSFDIQASLTEAHELIELIQSDRILIKVPATWEGIEITRQLEKAGIHCNVTIVVGLAQALAAAEAGATCIAPYVGRVTDWYKKQENATDDRGIALISAIHQTLKSYDFPTKIMAASFRNIQQILALSGLDILTIQPKLLAELLVSDLPAPRKLSMPSRSQKPSAYSEKTFRWDFCKDTCAGILLDDAIRRFTKDTEELLALLH